MSLEEMTRLANYYDRHKQVWELHGRLGEEKDFNLSEFEL